MIKLIEVLREELKKEVKFVKDHEANFQICNAIGEVIERKGLKADLSNPQTIEILKGSSNEILEIAKRSIWVFRKRARREEARRTHGDDEVVIDVTTPTEFLADERFQNEQITKLIWYVSGSSTFDVAITRAKDREGGTFNDIDEIYRQAKMKSLKANEKGLDEKLGKHTIKIEELILEHDGEELTTGEISRILDLPFATVQKRLAEKKDRMAKAKRRIKKEKLEK